MKPCKSNSGNIQGSVEREVTKNINGSPVRITSRLTFIYALINNNFFPIMNFRESRCYAR